MAKEKKYKYFVSYNYYRADGKGMGSGNLEVNCHKKFENLQELTDLARSIENRTGLMGVVIMHFVLLGRVK